MAIENFVIHKSDVSPYKAMERAAKVSTGRPLLTTDEEAAEWVNKWVVGKGHLSVLEHVVVSFKVIGSRAMIDQLVRHRHLSIIAESSQRVEFEKEDFPEPFRDELYSIYKKAREQMSKRDARKFIPLGIKSAAYVTCNLRALVEFIAKRKVKAASAEIRSLANQLEYLLHIELPLIRWSDLIDNLMAFE